MRFKLLPALSALAGLAAFFPAGAAAVGPITFLLITLATVLLSTFLVGYEMQQPPALLPSPSSGQFLPSAGKNDGGGFVGLSCFTGNLIALSMAGLTDPKNLLLLSWLNVLVVPYILFTVWYQRRAVRQWSIACLGSVVLAGAPLTAQDAPVVVKMIVLLVLPLLAARLQVRTYGKNLENQGHFFVYSSI